jgi:hypothetical protein
MQVKHTNISIASPPLTTKPESIPKGFSKVLDSSISKIGQIKHTVDSVGLIQNRVKPENNNLIKLGYISSEQPTVSHLSINHPQYGQECWKIIHSDLNKDKPYTRIPSGTKVYLEPESKEIIWDNSKNNITGKGTVNSFHASAINQSWKKPSSHEGKTTPVNPFLTNQRNKIKEQQIVEQSVSRASTLYNLPKELIMAVIKAESDFQAGAVSPAGAQGLMQLMPGTARELGIKNPFDIRENIEGGVRYLKKMLDIFNGNLEQALAAYNAGPQTIKNHEGRIPYQETRLYVKRVLSFFNHFK